jgi:transcriptional regulator with XRE-family HTH domain
VARARKQVAEGAPLIPLDVANRLASGENPVRVLRRWRDMPQVELAAAVGIGQGYLSDVESGKRKGPVELHAKFARALDVPVDLLMPIAVSAEEADPERFAERRRAVQEMRAARRAPRTGRR